LAANMMIYSKRTDKNFVYSSQCPTYLEKMKSVGMPSITCPTSRVQSVA